MLKIHKSSLLCTLLLGTAGASAQTQIDSEILSENPSYDITHALQDRVAGVDMKCVGTSPGEILDITIRGPKSLSSGSHPYILINGLPTTLSLSDIDPTEIDSICILKDASTAAIYGSRGKDGVILITTKSGKVNGARQLSYNSYVGMRQVFGRYPLMTGQELMDYRKLFEDFPVINNEVESIGQDIDWQDRLYETGLVNNHNLSFSYSWKTGGIHAGAGYVKDNGIIIHDDYSRLNFFLDIHQNLGRYVQLGVSAKYSIHSLEDNHINFKKYILQSPLLVETQNEEGTQSNELNDSKSLYANAFVEFNIPGVKGLQLRGDAGYSKEDNEVPMEAITKNTITRGSGYRHINLLFRERLSYEKTLAEKHKLFLFGQFSFDGETAKIFDYYYYDFDDGNRIEFKAAEFPTTKKYSTIAGHLGYTYDNRYELSYNLNKEEISYRENSYDYLNKKSFKFSQSLHSQWNLHNEGFFQEEDWIEKLSLRFDWGKICYPQMKGLYTKELFNTERYISSNWGLDFNLWNGRLCGSLDYYKQKNYNLHYLLDFIYLMNYNDAETENKGVELTLQGTIIDHWNDWTWSVGFNMATNRNKITKFVSKNFFEFPYYQGYPINTPYRSEYIGIWNDGDYNPDPERIQSENGMIKVKYDTEYLEDQNTNIYHYQRPVSMEPKMKGGFNSYVSWRNIDLNVVGAFQVGGQIYCNWYQETLGYGYLGNTIKVDYWTPENTDAHYPSPKIVTHYDAIGWYDASMCKIRTITLGYNVPEKWLEKMHINKCRIYATVQNPWVFGSDFYKEFKMDPETNQANYAYGYYQEYNFPIIGVQAPSTRNYIVGVNLSF